jgi:DNA repair photolyase
LHPDKHCPYSCAFCYVQGNFTQYPKQEIPEIINYLQAHEKEYDIIYISGDTDSFAPPRTEEGLTLLKSIAETLDKDIQFTTRTVLSEKHLKDLEYIYQICKQKNKTLIASVSIPRLYSGEHLEPKPIPSPQERIAFTKELKKLNIPIFLAIRPFLPVIPAEEYFEIIKQCAGSVDVVLGECWYTNDELLAKVMPNQQKDLPLVEVKMDFDTLGSTRKCREAKETEEQVRNFCDQHHIPFFMRSKPAVEYVR